MAAMRVLSNSESELLLSLHEGAFEQPLWNRFLEQLHERTQASFTCLVINMGAGAPMLLLDRGATLSNSAKEQILRSFRVYPSAHYRMREERVYALHELVGSDDSTLLTLCEDLAIPRRALFMRSVRISDQKNADAWLNIYGRREFDASVSGLLNRVAPHLRTSLRSFLSLEKERIRSSISTDAIGRLNFGWIALDPNCRILDATRNIDDIFQRTDAMQKGRHDHLTFSEAGIERDVRLQVRKIASGEPVRQMAINISQDPRMDLLIAPADSSSERPGGASAIVYISGDLKSRCDRCDQLSDLFGLLPSEARLAWAIARGQSIAEAAEELNITIETARYYSKKVYSKTGARGQADLVRIIFSSVLAIV